MPAWTYESPLESNRHRGLIHHDPDDVLTTIQTNHSKGGGVLVARRVVLVLCVIRPRIEMPGA